MRRRAGGRTRRRGRRSPRHRSRRAGRRGRRACRRPGQRSGAPTRGPGLLVGALVTKTTDLSDVDQAAHQLLVGECGHGILSLLSSSILHNSVPSVLSVTRQETYPHPYMNHGQPVQPVNPTIQTSRSQQNQRDISPPLTFHLEEAEHLHRALHRLGGSADPRTVGNQPWRMKSLRWCHLTS